MIECAYINVNVPIEVYYRTYVYIAGSTPFSFSLIMFNNLCYLQFIHIYTRIPTQLLFSQGIII